MKNRSFVSLKNGPQFAVGAGVSSPDNVTGMKPALRVIAGRPISPLRRWDDQGPNPFALFFLAVLAFLGVFSVVFVVFSLR
jgi:hypothetical protein